MIGAIKRKLLERKHPPVGYYFAFKSGEKPQLIHCMIDKGEKYFSVPFMVKPSELAEQGWQTAKVPMSLKMNSPKPAASGFYLAKIQQVKSRCYWLKGKEGQTHPCEVYFGGAKNKSFVKWPFSCVVSELADLDCFWSERIFTK